MWVVPIKVYLYLVHIVDLVNLVLLIHPQVLPLHLRGSPELVV
jgi:hypothetical protein